MHNTYELLLPLTKLFLCFQNKSSSTKIVIHASLCEGPFFYFMLSQFTYFFLSQKQTLVSTVCIDSYILAYLHSSYYFVLTIIHEIYMLKLKATAETYIFLCVASKPSIKNLLLYELTLMQDLLMLVLKVLFMKSLCYMIQLFSHYLYHCFE